MGEAITKKRSGRIKRLLLRVLCVVLATLLMLCAFLYGVMFVICKGPSETARDLFVMSVRETSAIGFLAELFFSEEEIAAIENRGLGGDAVSTDASLVAVSNAVTDSSEPFTDAWGNVDDDMDGIIIVPVAGESYVGNMMIVRDPSRVVLGCAPKSLGRRGYTVEEFVNMFDTVAGINGGGFEDKNGQGDGSLPNSAVVVDGEVYCGSLGVGNGFVGIDSEHILHVGFTSTKDITDRDIQQGAGYGPILVVNGEARDPDTLISGLNPRTAIGQRSDGAILMLVIDGRQATSLGATYQDEADIMVEFGAVNACNLDGGSSSLMWYNDGYINNCASVIGIRNIPTSFVVLKEGVSADD